MKRTTLLAIFLTSLAAAAEARLLRLEIAQVLPEPDGYERIVGRAYGEVDPYHPRNRIIQDVRLGPRNERGLVEYSMDFTVLRPSSGGNGLLFYEAPNRGFAFSELAGLFDSIGALARQRGYTIAYSGVQDNLVPFAPIQHTLQVPTATRHGRTVIGNARVQFRPLELVSTLPIAGTEIVPEAGYEPADLSEQRAVLLRRESRDGPAEKIPRGDWAFAACSDAVPFPGEPSSELVCLRGGFDPKFIYELAYTAKNPRVSGLGFAATRDFVDFLRHAPAEENPVAGTTRAAVMFGVSRSADFARQFLHLGFNESEAGRVVFDGMNPHVLPARSAVNIRFWTPMPPFQDAPHRPGSDFPFTYRTLRDPLSRDVGGLLARCVESRSCPKIIETFSSAEYWQSRASLTTTDPRGQEDIRLPENVRVYLFSSSQHIPAAPMQPPGICMNPLNTNDYRPGLRALIVALEEWVLEGRRPPKSVVPLLRQHTLVEPEQLRWPDLPGITYDGIVNELPLVDFGRRYDAKDVTGILSRFPRVRGRRYGVRVPQVDEDGNEIAGIRMPAIQAPLGTYTGWNLKLASFGDGRLCDLDGSFVPFAETRTERLAAGDPRRSLEERYGDHEGYVDAVRRAAERLVERRFLLPEDAAAIVEGAAHSDVLLR